MHASYDCMSSMLSIYAGTADHAVWVQVVKKATPPLIHPHFNEHASIEVHVLINSHIETCMSKLCSCMILVNKLIMKSFYMKHSGQLIDV